MLLGVGIFLCWVPGRRVWWIMGGMNCFAYIFIKGGNIFCAFICMEIDLNDLFIRLRLFLEMRGAGV